nr:hypothetical protein BaRGS_006606 [Batillaria attramentaria]
MITVADDFPKALAKKLRGWLLKDKHKFTPLIDCSFEPYEQDDVRRKNLELSKEVLKKQVMYEFNARSEQVMRLHNQKLEEVMEKIEKAGHNLYDLHKHKETKQEIEALEYKQTELENQREEFKKALDRFNCYLTTFLGKDTFEREIQNLRKQFGVECSRMERPLPVYARRHDIIELVKNNQVSIIVAETGSGKSTQIVQYLLGTDLAAKGTIVCTQPRKVAAISLATHVAKELATNVSKDVGYKVGSAYTRSASTKVVFMTDHSLLNECLEDPDLEKFSCIVVDEAHERSLYTDLLLGMIKRCMKKRPELRVIITSATIDPEVFVKFFGGNCPVMKISGRTFPVEVVWEDADNEESDFDNYEDEAVKKAIEIHTNEPPGDILVFLTSRIEIEKCCESFEQKMRTKNRTDFQCFPLHGQLQPDEQQKVFEPLGKNKRKIVFATNCAETSITIDGIKYVVDTGVAKEMRYDAKKNVNSLGVTIISKSSADQRKGRAGRTAPGKCYRLYSQRSYNDMDAISLPEILKTHLGQALLKLAELGIGPDMYDFVQSPSPDAISAALESLVQLGAMENGKITETGRWMARLPFDPKLGLLTLLGKNEDILYDAIVLAAVINAGSGVFYRGTTPEAQRKHDKAKSKFSSTGGDFLTSLAVYKEWQTVAEKQKRTWCMDNSINAKTIRGIRENINEVTQVLRKELKLDIEHKFTETQTTLDLLRKMVFRCYSANLCHYLGKERAGYFAARACRQVHIHPSSALNALAIIPEWVVYGEIMKTSRDFITGITPVEDSWLQEITLEKFGFDVKDIRFKKVLNVFTQPAGSHAFFALTGPRYSKMRDYEDQFSGSSAVVIVEASRERGEVKVYSTEEADSVRDLTQILADTAQGAVKELEKDDREMPVGREKSGLRVILGLGGQVIDILMPNESRKVYISQPSDDATEETVTRKFEQFGEIKFCKQFSGGKNWGFLIFRSVEDAEEAADATADDDCDRELEDDVLKQSLLYAVVGDENAEGILTSVTVKFNNVRVSIKAMDLEDAVEARTFLSDVFKGDALDCNANPSLQHLLTVAGRKFLQETEKDTGAYVCVDNRLRRVTIHGSDQACTKVEEMILKGSDNPPGLLKALITKHGDDLDGFRSDLGLHSVTVDYRRHKLKLMGTTDSLQKAKDQIQELKEHLWATSKEAKPEEDDIECPACFCPIEISELYRLEICAHPYCKCCLKQLC